MSAWGGTNRATMHITGTVHTVPLRLVLSGTAPTEQKKKRTTGKIVVLASNTSVTSTGL